MEYKNLKERTIKILGIPYSCNKNLEIEKKIQKLYW